MEMKCMICKKNDAVVHYAEVVEGEIKKLDLCEKCAVDKGFGTPVAFSMGDLVGGFTESQGGEKEKLKCLRCSMNFEDFRKSGRLGCDSCYGVFENSLSPMLEQIHRSTQHKGKVPIRQKKSDDQLKKITKLEEEMKEAVAREDFEKAAVLRDNLKKLKNGFSG